jgi:hypothetical protein
MLGSGLITTAGFAKKLPLPFRESRAYRHLNGMVLFFIRGRHVVIEISNKKLGWLICLPEPPLFFFFFFFLESFPNIHLCTLSINVSRQWPSATVHGPLCPVGFHYRCLSVSPPRRDTARHRVGRTNSDISGIARPHAASYTSCMLWSVNFPAARPLRGMEAGAVSPFPSRASNARSPRSRGRSQGEDCIQGRRHGATAT